MTFRSFYEVLATHPNHGISLTLPDNTTAPPHFHITEIGASSKTFIDCGGQHHSDHQCVLQVWVADDYDHRIKAGKLAAILDRARDLFDSPEIPVEFEHEAPVLTRLPIVSYEVQEDLIIFSLELKKADCLAKDLCLPKRDFSLPDIPARGLKTGSLQAFSRIKK